ncbi:hypothetical protein D3C87_1091180 [compost metagenome]
MEVVLQAAVLFGEDAGDGGRQVVLGQVVQGGAQGADHLCLARLRLVMRGLNLVALLLQDFEIDGDGQVHVQHDPLGQLGDALGGDAVMLALVGPELPGALGDGAGQVGQDDAVAADVPARLQADAGVDMADGAHGLGVVGVGATVDDGVPVPHLRLAGGGDVRLFAEEATRERLGAHPVVEGGQGDRRFAAQQRAHGAIAGRSRTQAHEFHAMFDVFARHVRDSLCNATERR